MRMPDGVFTIGAFVQAWESGGAEAEDVYRADLDRHPNNAWSLLGLQQSLQKQGKEGEAEALAEQVRQAWARADVSPVASCYCHPEARRQPHADRRDDPAGR